MGVDSVRIDLTGRIALVTGAANGIGRGIAEHLAAAGAHVLVNDVAPQDAEQVAAELVATGGSAEPAAADVADADAVAAMVRRLADRHGRLHVLVNNAGIAVFDGIEATTPEQWDRLMNVDLRGVYLVTRACLPLLAAGAPSAVTCIASVHAMLTVPFMTGYAAAKGGIVAMVRSLAQELGPRNIRVNAVSPGFVRTPLYESWLATEPDPVAADSRIVDTLPLRRIATVDDIAAMVTFLSSDHASCITGANHVVDSGLTARLMH